MTNDEPLIYTTRGNLPIASLKYKHEWFEDDHETRLVETYTAEDGEIVKQNVHIKIKQGLAMTGEQATL